MKKIVLALLSAALFVGGECPAEDKKAKTDDKKAKVDDAARGEVLALQGHWVLESYEEDGQPHAKSKIARKTIFFGGNQFVVRHGEQIVQTGVHKLDPQAKPKAVDAMVVSGMNKGEKMLGIYEITGDTLRLCFDIEGKERPREFQSKPDSTYFVAVYKRPKQPATEEIDIVGRYACDGVEMDGGTYSCLVDIQRQGDAYSVRWVRGPNDTYLGVGIRKGNSLSVSWLSRSGAGICVYQIEKSHRLNGEWTELGGIGALRQEILTPMK